MNNVKSLSIILLLSFGVVGFNYAKSGCGDDCSTSRDCGSGKSCGSDCSDSCNDSCSNDCNNDCNDGCRGGTSTFFRPRSVTTNLTYRNNLTSYQRSHDARCNVFTWDSAFIFSENRKEECLGAGFFGTNPITVGEADGVDFYSAHLGLARTSTTDGFEATVSICPNRRVFAWLPQFFFNLDCFCTGLWADISFAVVSARHRLNFHEVGNTGEIPGEPTTVREALDEAGTFANDCRHTGVDDVLFRVGYDYCYCSNDRLGIYLLGIAPTGKHFDNSKWFQPLVGSKHGAIGFGLAGDYTLWCDDNTNDLVFQTEFMYQYRLRHDENRIFDFVNGAGSRGFLVVKADAVNDPVTIADALNTCVRVEGRSQIEWWANLHYQWCNWGAELSYNLWWRDCEKIRCANFDITDFGFYDMTRCSSATQQLTTNSNVVATEVFNQGTADTAFTALTQGDVNLCSGIAKRVLTNTVSGAVSYNGVWCDCYPWYVGLSAGYEFAGSKDRRHAMENWHVAGKWGISW